MFKLFKAYGIVSSVIVLCFFITSCTPPAYPAGTGSQDIPAGATRQPQITVQLMKVNAKRLNMYAKADETSNVVSTFSRDDKLSVIANYDNARYYPVVDEHRSVLGYVRRDKVVDKDARLYARIPYTPSIMKNKDGTAPTKDNLVDVREYCDDFEIYMILAYADNFSGKPFYERDLCLLQKDTLDKLMAAQEKFKKDGYRIKIYDAYRPQHVQEQMFKIVNNRVYIADPKKASDHVRGAAVDITLVDGQGNELEMPSPMHTFGPAANVNSRTMTKKARENMKYMQRIMLDSGFLMYSGEWWHFKDSNFEQYNVTDHHFDDIEMVVAH